ncbi:Eclosion hormone [Papilio xuthus]|uniref:Eclosion hormone n=1 Tax=Papilio xuthus TaxID=66420 RepID=A0A194QNW8_PAPXU|nr:Eclosion hormone [Papilio xuthus]
MSSKYTFALICLTLVFIGLQDFTNAEPAIAFGYNPVEVCLENCAVCKKMLGAWFEGPRCAEACIRHRGTPIPDCEDFASIAPFLTKI